MCEKYKKKSRVEKSCLQASDRSKNMLSVQHGFELLCGNNRLPNQLLLSSEIAPFEYEPSKNPWKSSESLWDPYDILNTDNSSNVDF